MLLSGSARFPAARTRQGTASASASSICASRQSPKDHVEALGYLRERLARYDRFWPEPNRQTGSSCTGLTTLRRSGSFSRQARRHGPAHIGWAAVSEAPHPRLTLPGPPSEKRLVAGCEF
jgi:hypothetical protein